MSGFDIDLVMGPRRSARIAWIVASCSVAISLSLAATLIVLMPLKETEVFTVLVDRTTGAAERIYQVQPTGISDEEAVQEALLVGYVSDREGYFRPGIQERLEAVERRSRADAAETLVRLWSAGHDNYPPDVYGPAAQVSVTVRAITILEEGVAQIRFVKELRRPNLEPVSQTFIATVAFEFDPRRERSLERVWENPLGFAVTAYSVDAETLQR